MEKRKFSRYVFQNNERMIALLALNSGSGTVEARILNISQGGLGLVIERGNIDNLKVETILFLKEVTGKVRVSGLKGHSLKVKWILDYKPLNNLAIGCEFIDLNEQCRLEIDALLKPV